MSHLGDRLTAMVDGELSHEARDRVLAHLTMCAECRAEAEDHRSLKFQLGDLGGPSPSADLVQRLLGLAAPGGPMPRQPAPAPGRGLVGLPRGRPGGGPFGGAYSSIPSEPFGGAPAGGALAAARFSNDASAPSAGRARSRSSRLRFALVAMVSMVALALSAGFAAGGQPATDEDTRRVAPPVDAYAVEHAVTVGEVPVSGHRADPPGNSVTFTDLGP